jgi:hypothetical protein
MTPTTHQYKKFSDFRRDTISYSVDGRTTTMPNMSEKDKVTFIKEVIWYVWNGATILPGEKSTLHLAIERAIFEREPKEYNMAEAQSIAKKALAYCYENIKPENGFYLEDASTGLLYTVPKIISGKIFFNALPRSEKNDRYTLLSDLQAYIVANIVRKENPDAGLNLVKAN